jgi:hypothetical protein
MVTSRLKAVGFSEKVKIKLPKKWSLSTFVKKDKFFVQKYFINSIFFYLINLTIYLYKFSCFI